MPDDKTPDEQAPAPNDTVPNTAAPTPADTPVVGEETKELADEVTGEETEEVILEPSTVHPAAPAGFTEEDAKAGAEEYGEFFIGMWGDKPNFGCPYCYYASLEGSGDIELHILSKIDSGDIVHRAYIQVPEEGA